uniref:Uncharacterized protein n=1 Tax=Aegilops tauschii subsp. strangulata TaxID=200361 RepID=A0A452ZZV1_AEGTS
VSFPSCDHLTIISRWDIIAERLGFMLVFGDLVFIPFTFTIQVFHLWKKGVI